MASSESQAPEITWDLVRKRNFVERLKNEKGGLAVIDDLPAMIDAGYDRTKPYVAGIVELEEGPRISAQMLGVDGKQPALDWIGRPVRTSFVERGEGKDRRAYLTFEMDQ